MPSSSSLTGAAGRQEFMCALGLSYNEHSKRLAEVKLQGRRVHRDLGADMSCVTERFRNISNLPHPCTKTNTRQTDGGTEYAAQKLGVCCNAINGSQRRGCWAQSWPDSSSRVQALLQLRAGTCTATLLEVCKSWAIDYSAGFIHTVKFSF